LNFIEKYAGTYKCIIRYPYNVIEYNFVVEVDSSTTTERICEARGNTHAIEIVGTIDYNEKGVFYNPRMKELNSEVRQLFETKLCTLLHESRIDIQLKPTFHISCALIDVHPISSEFVLVLKVHDEHLKYLGFEMNRDGAMKAIQSIYNRPSSHDNMLFYFKTLSPAYQTVFIEGALYIDKTRVEHTPDYDKWDSDEFQQLDEKVCSLIETWCAKDILLRELPIDCTAYAMDLDSKLVVQLSVYNRDLVKLGIPTDERSVATAIENWFARIPEDFNNVEYRPHVILP
uniref:Tudor domain-containing protein n=1 Tax=Echinostoma caproni TaxID=27848 RepID=A0A183AQB2_9TREM